MIKVEYVVLPHREIHTTTFETEKQMYEWIEKSKRLGIEVISKPSK